jgi:hypothetical protein
LRALSGDWVQTILEDREGQGVGPANARLGKIGVQLRGRYIWLLDDDDLCVRPTLVDELRQIVAANAAPDVIMVRMDHGPRGIQPDNAHWGGPPTHGHVGCSAYIVRRRVWQMCAHTWRAVYHADFEFAEALFERTNHIYWHDVIASRVQCIGFGRGEREIGVC